MQTAYPKKEFLSAFVLKIIAAAAMLTDHIAVVFFDSQLWMRCAGRLAFPIFAFFIAEGYRHTRDVKKYVLRLFVFSLVAQAPYELAFGEKAYEPNVIFTLFLALCALWAYDKGTNAIKWIVPAGAVILAELSGSDHGAFGVVMVMIFFIAETHKSKLLTAGILVLFMATFYVAQSGSFDKNAAILLFYLLPLFLLYFYSGERGPGGRFMKWFFYIFYPLHLLLIWLFSVVWPVCA